MGRKNGRLAGRLMSFITVSSQLKIGSVSNERPSSAVLFGIIGKSGIDRVGDKKFLMSNSSAGREAPRLMGSPL